MLGDDLRVWYELFDGIVVYRPQSADEGGAETGWINFTDIENQFINGRLIFGGQPYDPSNREQKNKLLDAIVNFANIFVNFRLLEKRRHISPPSLDYRPTPFGRRVGNWGYGPTPGFKKRSIFFIMALGLLLYKYRILVALGAAGWAIVNAIKFYSEAINWVQNGPFGVYSAAVIAFFVGLILFIKEMFGSDG